MRFTIVTGGAGFLGRALVERLCKRGEAVLVIDNLSSPGWEPALKKWGVSLHTLEMMRRTPSVHRPMYCSLDWSGYEAGLVRFVRADLTEFRAASTWFEFFTELCIESRAIDQIFHFASPASPSRYKARARETLLLGSATVDCLLDLQTYIPKSSLIYASSSEVYGMAEIIPTPEDYPGRCSSIGPRSMYDEAKRFGEALCMAEIRHRDADARILRIHNTYGPGMGPEDGRVVSSLIWSALKGEPFQMHNQGKQTRCFCYLDDMIDQILLVADLDAGHHALREPFNLGTDVETSIGMLVYKVDQILKRRTDFEFRPAQDEHDPLRRVPLLDKIRGIGGEAKVDLDEGLRRTIAWMQEVLRR
jgi:nucleoside-diphosphate-sugar epimerase